MSDRVTKVRPSTPISCSTLSSQEELDVVDPPDLETITFHIKDLAPDMSSIVRINSIFEEPSNSPSKSSRPKPRNRNVETVIAAPQNKGICHRPSFALVVLLLLLGGGFGYVIYSLIKGEI